MPASQSSPDACQRSEDWESKAIAAIARRNRAWGILALVTVASVASCAALDAWWPEFQEPLPAEFVVELNQASVEELSLLPGIGPKSAKAIVAHRDRRGGFTRVEELTTIPGIKEGKLRSLRPYITVDPRYAKR